MHQILLLTTLATISGFANAALVDRHSGQPFRFWISDRGVQASTINAMGMNTRTIVRGQGNTAMNSVGLIAGGAIIRGSVHINAVATGTTAVAVGSGNTATNDIGTIGRW